MYTNITFIIWNLCFGISYENGLKPSVLIGCEMVQPTSHTVHI